MFISAEKKKENIAEYLLYMWQIEDIIRAYKFDIEKINAQIILPYPCAEDDKKALLTWYENLIDMMREEHVIELGHLQINNNILIDLNDLHQTILTSNFHQDYKNQYYKTNALITEIKAKQGNAIENEIEVCFTFLYGFLLLKLQKKAITKETATASNEISQFIALLASKYKLYKAGKLELE